MTNTPTDRAALRDRIAAALANADGWELGEAESFPFLHEGQVAGYRRRADAVLAVLPAPVDRAAVLRELADRANPQRPEVSWFGDDGPQVAAWISKQADYEGRRMAAEAQQPEAVCKCPTQCGHKTQADEVQQPPSDKHAAIYVDEDGDPWVEYLTSPRTDHVVGLQLVSEEAVDRRELEDRIGKLTLIGWCRQA